MFSPMLECVFSFNYFRTFVDTVIIMMNVLVHLRCTGAMGGFTNLLFMYRSKFEECAGSHIFGLEKKTYLKLKQEKNYISIFFPFVSLCIDIITIYVAHRSFRNKICLNQTEAYIQ